MAHLKYADGRIAFRIRYGRFRGLHEVYRTIDAFHAIYPEIEPKIWYEGRVGEWVRADDGTVAMCLDRYQLKNRTGQITLVFRVPWGCYPLYIRKKDGKRSTTMTYRIKKHYQNGKGSMGKGPKRGKFLTKRKRAFVRHMLLGLGPTEAYMQAYNHTNPHFAEKQAMLILTKDKSQVMEAIKSMYKELFDDEGLDRKGIAHRLTEIANNGKSNMAALEAIKTILILRGEAPGSKEPAKVPEASKPMSIAGEMSAPRALQPAKEAEFEEIPALSGDQPKKSFIERQAELSADKSRLYNDTYKKENALPVFNPDVLSSP